MSVLVSAVNGVVLHPESNIVISQNEYVNVDVKEWYNRLSWDEVMETGGG